MQPTMKKLMEQARHMQEKMSSIQEKISKLKAQGSSGGNMVMMLLSGDGKRMESITIDANLCAAGQKEIVEDLVIAAYHHAQRHAEELREKEMRDNDLVFPKDIDLF